MWWLFSCYSSFVIYVLKHVITLKRPLKISFAVNNKFTAIIYQKGLLGIVCLFLVAEIATGTSIF